MKSNKKHPKSHNGSSPKQLNRKHWQPKLVAIQVAPGDSWCGPLCLNDRCVSQARWRYSATGKSLLPYCDRHLPLEAHLLSGLSWDLRFAPVGHLQSGVPDHLLAQSIDAGFKRGATECLVRRSK